MDATQAVNLGREAVMLTLLLGLPVLLVGFAAAYGWHKAFYLAGVPGLLSALLLWRFIREPAAGERPVAVSPRHDLALNSP